MSCPAHALAASRGMLAAADVDLIREVVAKLPSGSTIVDVGAGSGTTALAVFAERTTMHLVSIEADVSIMNWARQAVENIGASELWDDRVEDAIEAAVSFPDSHASFIILDAAHEEDDVRAELEAWLPKLAPGGYLLVHDYDAYTAPNFYPGVKAAVDPFIAKDELQRVKQQGWSILLQSTYSDDDDKAPSWAPGEGPEEPEGKPTPRKSPRRPKQKQKTS
ncbi:hypothetical protein LCGC14_0936210 [marine sediment metagenome]|uniref:Methyltransferase domain-containing protein n=1 Tax=marine sediment metagenome TaxID=412755 RepID=A0A0F9P7J6_9ZZZZ